MPPKGKKSFDEISDLAEKRDRNAENERKQLKTQADKKTKDTIDDYRGFVNNIQKTYKIEFADFYDLAEDLIWIDCTKKHLAVMMQGMSYNQEEKELQKEMDAKNASDEERKTCFSDYLSKKAGDINPNAKNYTIDQLFAISGTKFPKMPDLFHNYGAVEKKYQELQFSEYDSKAKDIMRYLVTLPGRNQGKGPAVVSKDMNADEAGLAEKYANDYNNMIRDLYDDLVWTNTYYDAFQKMLAPDQETGENKFDKAINTYISYLMKIHNAEEDPSELKLSKDEQEQLEQLQKLYSLSVNYVDHYDAVHFGGLEVPPENVKTENGKKIHRVDGTKYDPVILTEKVQKKFLRSGIKVNETKYSKRDEATLFDTGLEPNDVEQGALGDCYLLAGLISIAQHDPDVLRNSMRDNRNGTITVRFFNKADEPVYVTVKDTIPKLKTDSGTIADPFSQGAYWVKIVEKAYVQSGIHIGRMEKAESGSEQFRYDSIEGGYPSDFIRTMLGSQQSKYYRPVTTLEHNFSKNTGDYTPKETAFFDKLKNALNLGEIVTCDIQEYQIKKLPKKYQKIDNKELRKAGLVSDHAYSILGAEEKDGKYYIKIRNPHRNEGTEPDANNQLHIIHRRLARGDSYLELRDFSRYFDEIAINHHILSPQKKELHQEAVKMIQTYKAPVKMICDSLKQSDSAWQYFNNSSKFKEFKKAAVQLSDLMESKCPLPDQLNEKMEKLISTAKAYREYCESKKKIDTKEADMRAVQRYKNALIVSELEKTFRVNQVKKPDEKYQEFSYQDTARKTGIIASGLDVLKSSADKSEKVAKQLFQKQEPFDSAENRQKWYKACVSFIENEGRKLFSPDKLCNMPQDQQFSFLREKSNTLVVMNLLGNHAKEICEMMKDDNYFDMHPKMKPTFVSKCSGLKAQYELLKYETDHKAYQLSFRRGQVEKITGQKADSFNEAIQQLRDASAQQETRNVKKIEQPKKGGPVL